MSPGDFTIPSDTRYVGDVFNVTITVSDVQRLYSWQVKLLFNTTILNCTGIGYPPDHVFSGHGIIPVDPIIDNVAGYALTGSSLVGVDGINVTGVGNVINFEFEALANGTSMLNFSRPYGADTFLLDDAFPVENIINVTLVDGNVGVIVPEFNVPALTFVFMFTTLIIIVVAKKALPKPVHTTASYST
jgi:hypothetical protein